MRPLRRDLLESALAFYEEFLKRRGDDPSILADLAATQFRVGMILAELGDDAKARTTLRKAAALYDQALAARPGDVEMLERQAEAWHRLGDLDYRTDPATAGAAYKKAVAIREQLAKDHPQDPRFRMALSRSLNGVGLCASRGPAALPAYRRSLELRLKLAEEIPGDADLLHGLGESFHNLGAQLMTSPEHALELFKRSIDYCQAALDRRPHDLEFAGDLGASYSSAANLCWFQDRRDEALALYADQVALYRRLASENPDVPLYRMLLVQGMFTNARYLSQAGQTENAMSLFRELAESVESQPESAAATYHFAIASHMLIAEILLGDHADSDIDFWPEPARHEADLAVADLRKSIDRGFHNAAVLRPSLEQSAHETSRFPRSCRRDGCPAKPSVAQQPADTPHKPPLSSPLDHPGRLEEDQFLGELTIGLLENNPGNPTADGTSPLEAMLARVESRMKAGANLPALEAAARALRSKIGERLWKLGELAKAERMWDESFKPAAALKREKQVPEPVASPQAAFGGAAIVDLYFERGSLGAGLRVARAIQALEPGSPGGPLLFVRAPRALPGRPGRIQADRR